MSDRFFHSHPPTSSLSPPRVERIGENENDCQQLDDTMVLYSRLAETQMEKLNETQVLDDSGVLEDVRLQQTYGDQEEVVLDREDEGIRGHNQLSAGHALNLQKQGSAFVHKQCGVGNKACERTEEQKDCPQIFNHDFAKLNYINSQEPGESSQDDALEFVDQFLSSNIVDLSPKIGAMKTVRDIIPPVSGAKRPQNLVKRLNSRSPITKSAIFEWADGDQHVKDALINKRTEDSQSECVNQKSEIRCRKGKHLDCKKVSISDNEHQEKRQLVDFDKKTVGSTRLDLRFVKQSPEETCGIKLVCKMTPTNNSVKESDEDLDLHAESSERQLNTDDIDREAPDMYDVGFNTQIAAEAMEALSCGPIASRVAFDAHKGSSNTTEESPKSIIMGKAHPEHISIQKKNCSNVEGIRKKSKQGMRSASKYGKNSNKQKLDLYGSELAITTRAKRGKSLVRKESNHKNANVSSGRRPPRLIVQRQTDGNYMNSSTSVEGDNDTENNMNSSISAEHISLSKEQTEREFKITSVAQETMQSWAEGSSTKTSNQSGNPAERTEDRILTYRRKRSRLPADPTKIVSAKGRWSELHYNTSAESRNSKLGQKEQTYQEVTATSCLETDIWSHPKRKRTQVKMQGHSDRAISIYVSLAIVNGNQRTTEDNDKTTCYHRDMKKKVQSVSSYPSCHFSENNFGQKFDKTDLEEVISNGESAGLSKKIFPGQRDRLQASMQSDKEDGINCMLHGNGVEKNHKLEVSSCKNLEPPGLGSTTNITDTNTVSSNNISSKFYKHPSKKHQPKSSLLKELIRLGVPGSIPDFTRKDLRRRRDITHVRVLFSQHLDDDVIRQQKKISARLGISIATCSIDATHFIADRFLRTRNMLEAIALAKPVVTHLWLESCGQANCLIDEKNYILRDGKKEKEIGFSMPVSFASASQHPLLEGQRVFVTPNIKPHKEMIASLVKLVQGQVVERSQIPAVEDQKIQDDILILSCDEDHAICVPFLDQGVAAYSSELLLNGIVIQKLEFERHQLFKSRGIHSAQDSGREVKVCKEMAQSFDTGHFFGNAE